jgi:hypothetical protein
MKLRYQNLNMENNVICIACGKQVETNYCGNCGQIMNVKESTILSLINDFFSNLFSLQNSFPAAFWKLLIAPNKVIDSYYKGYRGYYPSPGKMVLFAFAIAAFHILFIDANMWGVKLTVGKNPYSSHLFLLLMSVLLISATSYLTFIKTKIKFVKHLISATYLWGVFFTIFLIISDVILALTGKEYVEILGLQLLTIMIWNAIVFTRQKKPLLVLGNLMIHLVILTVTVLLVSLLLMLIGGMEYNTY